MEKDRKYIVGVRVDYHAHLQIPVDAPDEDAAVRIVRQLFDTGDAPEPKEKNICDYAIMECNALLVSEQHDEDEGQLIKEETMADEGEMEKYGQRSGPLEDGNKTASANINCPWCGARCEIHGKTVKCPEHGTAPFTGGTPPEVP